MINDDDRIPTKNSGNEFHVCTFIPPNRRHVQILFQIMFHQD